MGKTTNRVLSMILAVLMAVSMFTGICLPAYAASEPVKESPYVDLSAVPQSDDIIDEANLDYEALRKADDTIIINGGWTADDLKAGAKVSYYFKGVTYTEDYNAKRHFAKWSDAYKVYTAKLNADNILTYVPVFIFAPGEYSEEINVHGNGILLGSNAGVSPNDNTVKWDYKNFKNGWPANKNWDGKASIISAAVYNGTRIGTTEDGPFHYYLEQAKSKNGGKAEYECVMDGFSVTGSFCYNGNGFDTKAYSVLHDGQTLAFSGSAGTVNNKILQNTSIDGVTGALAMSWDASNRLVSVFLNDVRVNGFSGTRFFTKYMTNAVMTRVSFNGMGKYVLQGNADDPFAAQTTRRDVQNAQTVILRDSAWVNGTCAYPFTYGLGAAHAGTIDVIFDNNIIYNAKSTTGGQYGLVKPDQLSDAGGMVNTVFINNQFFQDENVMLYCVLNANAADKYQTAPYTLHVENNRFIGNIGSISVNEITASDVAVLRPYVVNNFHGDDETSGGYAANKKGDADNSFANPSGFSNGFDYVTAPYYLDYEMTTLSTDWAVQSITNLPESTKYTIDEVEKEIQIDATDWTPEEKVSVISPAFHAISPDCTAQYYSDAACKNEMTAIDLSTLGEVAEVFVKVVHATYDHEVIYKVVLVKSEVVDYNAEFNEIKEKGELFSHLNLDPDYTFVYIPDLGVGEKARGYFNGKYYEFTAEDGDYPAVTGDLTKLEYIYNLDKAMMDNVPTYNIILPSGEYDSLEITIPAHYYGVNAGLNPILKGENRTDEWTLRGSWGNTERWGSLGTTGVGAITVAEGVEGVLTFDGITMRANFADTLRTTDSGNLAVNFNNIVVEQTLEKSKQDHLFNIENDRTKNSADKEFGESYADEFNIKNLYIKTVKASKRMLSNYVPAKVSVDNMYVDYDKSYQGSTGFMSIFAYFKNGSANKKTDITIKNSMFRDYDSAAEQQTLLFSFQPQINKGLNLTPDYNVTIENNVFYNAATGEGIMTYSPSLMSSFNVKNNYFHNGGAPVMAIGVAEKAMSGANSPYWTDEDRDGYDDNATGENISITSNYFIGFTGEPTVFDMGLKPTIKVFRDNYISNKLSLTGLNGVGTLNGEDDFWLDFNKTVTVGDFKIVKINGTEDFTQCIIDHSNSEITMVTDSATINADDFILSWKVESGTLKNSAGSTVNRIVVGKNSDSILTYYYTIKMGEYEKTYTIMVYTYEPSDFLTSEDIPEEIRDGMIVWSGVTGEPGADIVVEWKGSLYHFTVGVNAFEKVEDAVTYATSNGIRPKILLPEYEGNLNVTTAMDVYTPNYDTVPYIRGTATDGSDWAENDEWSDYEVRVGNIAIGGSVEGEVNLYGLTMNGQFTDWSRSTQATITLKNLLVESTAGIPLFGTNSSSKQSANNADVLNVVNTYIKQTATSGRLVTEYVPAYVTFDGLWIPNGNQCGLTGINYIKVAANDSAFTIKNSCIRNWYPTTLPDAGNLIIWEGNKPGDSPAPVPVAAGQKRAIIYDNNILYNFAGRIGGSAMPYIHYWRAPSYSDYTFTNNEYIWAITELNGTPVNSSVGMFNTQNIDADTYKNPAFGKVTITDNNFAGHATGVIIDGGGKTAQYLFDVHHNFNSKVYSADYKDVYGFKVNANSSCISTGEKTFYMDYEHKLLSNQIYDYKVANADNIIKCDAAKTIYYTVEPEDTRVAIVDNGNGTSTYTVNMASLVTENLYNNAIDIGFNGTYKDYTKELSFTTATADSVTLDLLVASPDETVNEKWKLVISKNAPLFINGAVVDEVNSIVALDTSNAEFDAANGIADVINPVFVDSVNYSTDGQSFVNATEPLTMTDDPTVVTVNANNKTYTLYIASDYIGTELKFFKIGEKDVKRSGTVVFEAADDRTISYELSKFSDIVIKDVNGNPVTEIVLSDGQSASYLVTVTDSILNGVDEFSFTVAIKANTGKIDEIKEMVATTVFAKDYTAASIKKLNDAITAGDAVDLNTATQAKIDAAYKEILDAYNALVPVAPMVDAVTNAANEFITGKYCVDDKYDALVTAMEAIETLVETATDINEANAAVDAVNAAVANLTKHSFTEYVSDENATCLENGTKTALCEYCSEPDTVEVPDSKIDHAFNNYVYLNDATCIADGHEKAVCAYGCGTADTRVKAGTKLEHKYTNYVPNPDGSKTAYCDYGCGENITAEGSIVIQPGDDNVKPVFTDVKTGSWYEGFVDYVAANGLMNGTSKTTFAPDTTMTRSMLVTILARMAGVDTDALKNTATKFTDVKTGTWYSGAVVWAVENGITTGTTATTFAPDTAVTREDICVFFVRYAQKAGITLKTDVAKTAFPDDAKIGSWAKDAVYACQQAGIVAGTNEGIFNPKGNATRSAVAKIVTVFHKDYVAK